MPADTAPPPSVDPEHAARNARRRRTNQVNIMAGFVANLVAAVALFAAGALGWAHIPPARAGLVALLGLVGLVVFTLVNVLQKERTDTFMDRFFWGAMCAQLVVYGYGALIADAVRDVALIMSMVLLGLLFLRATVWQAVAYGNALAGLFLGASVIAPWVDPSLENRFLVDVYRLVIWFPVVWLMSFLAGQQRATRARLSTQRAQLQERGRRIEELYRRLRSHLLRRLVAPELADDILAERVSIDDAPDVAEVTIMVVDVYDFTAATRRVPPSATAEYLADYFALCSEVASRHGAAMYRFLGDRLILLFGAPVRQLPREQARRAADAARDLHRRIAHLDGKWIRRGVGATKLKIALHHGPTALGFLSAQDRVEYVAVGSAMDAARQIASQASPGETVVSDAVAGLLEMGTAASSPGRFIRHGGEQLHLQRLSDGAEPAPTAVPVAEGLPVHIGGVYDKLHIRGVIAAGGMATVFEVHHADFDTDYALKVLHRSSPDLVERLRQEARIQANLRRRCEYIVDVREVVEIGGRPALLLELIRGCTLEDLLVLRWRPEVEVAVAIAHAVATVLRVAHEPAEGPVVVHRDLKPSNILLHLEPAGAGRVVPKVADFGIAKVVGTSNHTVVGAFLGTPVYAAPEQRVDAAGVGPPADVWALGAVLFQLLTGFVAPSHSMTGPPQRFPLDHPELPAPWRGLVGRMLAHEPAQRPSAGEVVEALAGGRSTEQVSAGLGAPSLIAAVEEMLRRQASK